MVSSSVRAALPRDPDIFVSYRRTDLELVKALVPLLEARGALVWWDAQIEGGDDWRDSIVENLTKSHLLIILFSEACNSSKQLKKELAVADHLDKHVIPILIEETEPRGHFLYELAARNWIRIFPDPMSKLDQLADGIVGKVRPPVKMPDAPPPPQDGPKEAAESGSPGPAAEQVTAEPPDTPIPDPVAASRATTTKYSERDFLPFRWVDFILPILFALLALIGSVEDEAGTAEMISIPAAAAIMVLAAVGLIAFPIRYYRRQRSPYRVAKMLVLSNLVLSIALGVGFSIAAELFADPGDTVGETRFYLLLGSTMLGLLVSAVSFAIFFLLSALRARRKFNEGMETL